MTDRPALAAALDLEPHPEGGWYRQTWRTEVQFAPAGYSGERVTATGIYYLLGPGEVSRWHQVRSDELWLHHGGVPLRLMLGGSGPEPGPTVDEVILGLDVAAGQRPAGARPCRSMAGSRARGRGRGAGLLHRFPGLRLRRLARPPGRLIRRDRS